MTLGDALITLHHLIGDRTVQDAVGAIATEEARKCTEETRRYLRDGETQKALLSEVRADTWEKVLPTLKGYGEKYTPSE